MINYTIFIDNIKDDCTTPESVDRKFRNTLGTINDRGNTEIVKKKPLYMSRFAFALVLILFGMIAITTVAAAIIHWSKTIKEEFDISDDEQKLAEDIGLVDNPNTDEGRIFSEDAGVTVWVEQTIVDDERATVCLAIEGLQEIDSDINFGNLEILLDGVAATWSMDEILFYEDEDNHSEVRIDIYGSNNQRIIGKKAELTLSDIGTFGIGGFTELIHGSWKLSWILEGSDYKKQWSLNEEIGNTGIIIETVSLSPIGIVVNCTTEFESADGNEISDENFPNFFGIKNKDGTCLYYLAGNGGFGFTDETKNELIMDYELEKMIFPENVEGLFFLKNRPFDSENISEDDLYFIILP